MIKVLVEGEPVAIEGKPKAAGGAAVADPVRGRDHSLDGLRGVAAFVVLLSHCLLVVPALAEPYLGGNHASGWAWWLTNTPLHTFWAGGEAVFVFFVLSGFVLTPRGERTLPAWLGYYGSRLPRLYLPVFGAVALALAAFAIVHRTDRPGSSWWLNAHHVTVTGGSVARDAFLLRGTDYLNSPLWSLQWEVVFSLLLPAYVIFSRSLRRLLPLKVAALLVVVFVGLSRGNEGVAYLPLFALGSLAAVERVRLVAAVDRMNRRWPRGFWPSVLALLVVGINASWLVSAAGPRAGYVVNAAVVVEILAAFGIFVTALLWRPGRDWLERPTQQWLGTRSFSLYLVHEPVVVSVALVLGHRLVGLTIVIAVPLSLLVTEAFYRVVERPSHRLARRASRRLTALAEPSTAAHRAAA